MYGITAYDEVGALPDSPELAILTIPAQAVEQVIEACGRNGVKGVTIISAGYGEAVENGKEKEHPDRNFMRM